MVFSRPIWPGETAILSPLECHRDFHDGQCLEAVETRDRYTYHINMYRCVYIYFNVCVIVIYMYIIYIYLFMRKL